MSLTIRNSRRRLVAGMCLAVACAIGLGFGPLGAAEKADGWARQLATDVCRSVSGPRMQGVAFCYPPEFWDVAVAAHEQPIDAEALRAIKSFVIVGVLEAEGDSVGPRTFRTEAQVRRAIKLVDSRGREHRPLAPDSMDAVAEELTRRFESEVGHRLGEFGVHVHFFAFRTTDGDSLPIVDAHQAGSFAIDTGAARYDWQLPLLSLVPPAVCPIGGEVVSGPAKYCPQHGAALKRAAHATPQGQKPAAESDKTRVMKDPTAI